jgi:serine/threonine protein kinase
MKTRDDGCKGDLAHTDTHVQAQSARLGTGAQLRSQRELRSSVFSGLTGQTLAERFEVLELLGFGGMGAVYHVRDTKPDTNKERGGRFRSAHDEYALKVYIPILELAGPGTSRPFTSRRRLHQGIRFVREFRMGQRDLSSSGRVARTYDFATTSIRLPELPELHAAAVEYAALTGKASIAAPQTWAELNCFTMDLVQGGHVPWANAPQPPELVAALAIELFVALDELHGRAVVHRDLSHANVLLHTPWSSLQGAERPSRARFPKVVLADLGIAIHGALRDDGPIGPLVGTPAFMPPESRILGNRDPRTDLFAAGIILYKLATGHHPMEAAGYQLHHALSGKPYELRRPSELVPEFPQPLETAIMQLLIREPERRTPTAAQAHDAFASWWQQHSRPFALPKRPKLAGRPYLCSPHFVGRQDELTKAREFLRATLDFRPPEQLAREDLFEADEDFARKHLPPCLLTISGEDKPH